MHTGLEQGLNSKELSKDFNGFSLQSGKLIYTEKDKTLEFEDAYGKRQPLERVYFLGAEYNTEDGEKRMPKPYIKSETGYKSLGDILLYSIIDNNVNRIVVLGSIRNFNVDMHDKALNYDKTDIEDLEERNLVRNNDKRYFTVRDDGKGNILVYLEGKKGEKTGTGNVSIKVQGADEKSGNVKLEVSGKVAINQIVKDGETEKITTQILMDNTKDAEKIQIKDQFKNTIVVDKKGVALTDSNKNTIVTSKDGIAITDFSENHIITTAEEINIKTAKNFTQKTEKKYTINVGGDANISVEGKTVLKSPDVTITGGKLTVNGTAAPTGSGGFCGIPACIFSSAPHVGNVIQST
jgi:hypothetical protein